MAITGNLGTLSFASLSLAITRITMRESTLEALEDSDLETTNYKTYVPADLAEPGGIDVEFFYDITDMVAVQAALIAATPGAVIVTDKNSDTLTATGFMDRFEPGELANNELISASLGIQFDGKTTEPLFADVA